LARKRELAAAVAIPIVLAVLFFTPPVVFDILVGAIALLTLWEFYRLAEKTGHPVAKVLGLVGGAIVMVLSPVWWLYGPVFANQGSPILFPCAIGGILLIAVAPMLSGVSPGPALAGASSTAFGVLLIAFPATALCYLRQFSPSAVLYLLGVVWICDSCAYYGGRRWGRRKLAPVVSPNKTWEGTIAGFVGATVFGAAAGTWLLLPVLGPVRGALAGALASSAGQVGDLVKSLWKRGAGVKDSGVFLPGHGGFYDRVDSLLFAGPVLAAFVATL
jgi:phosphatidate cytidylyltransferase